MARSTLTIKVRASVVLLMAWVRLMRVASHVVGERKAMDWAYRAVPHLTLVKIDGGRWHRLGGTLSSDDDVQPPDPYPDNLRGAH